jgi:putative ABC transport system ATP-binding protein
MAKSSELSADAIREKIAECQQQIRSYAEQRAEGLIDVDLQRTLVKDLQAEIKTLENQLSQAVASPAVPSDNNTPTAQADTSDTSKQSNTNAKTNRRKNKKRAKASDSANTPPTEDSTPKQDDTVVIPVSSEPAPTEPADDSKAVSVGNFADDVVVSSAVVTGSTDLNSIHEPNVVDIRDITKTYFMGEFDLEVLKGISLQVRQGEFVSIMGPSGSGKSTLMNILGALDQPTSGEYFLDNVDVSKLDEKALAEIRNSKIGFVFQNFNLLKRTTALRQVELPLIYGSHKERSRKAREALESVGLGQRLDHTPAELSGGQQQRVAIARALVTEPSLILADEPTGNLDSRSGTEVMQLFQSLNRNNNITTIFVTHDPWIARHTDRVIMLRDGKIIADQRVKEPLIAGEAERPSEAEELQAIFESTYYGGDEDEYT